MANEIEAKEERCRELCNLFASLALRWILRNPRQLLML